MKANVVAIVPAAGAGKRFGDGTRKPFEILAGKPVLIRTLEALNAASEIEEIIPVIKEEEMEYAVELFEEYPVSKVRRIAPGGRERHDSVLHGLQLVESRESLVLIHDGVRPLIEPHLVSYALKQFRDCDGVVLGVPVKDTIKEVKEGKVQQTLNRQLLWAIQTPQIFRYGPLFQAYERAAGEAFSSTDDAALVEKYGGTVRVVMGSYENIKITTPGDMVVADAVLKMRGGAL